jgi:hypothetical protein
MANVSPAFGSIKPSQKQQILSDNYLSFTDGTNDFAQQYLPEIYEARSRKLWKQNSYLASYEW